MGQHLLLPLWLAAKTKLAGFVDYLALIISWPNLLNGMLRLPTTQEHARKIVCSTHY